MISTIALAAPLAGASVANADPFTWSSPTPTPNIAGGTAISCPSTSQCTAVGGEYETTTDPGTSYVTSYYIDGYGSLQSVSCPATTVCVGLDANGTEIDFNPDAGASRTWHSVDSGAYAEAVSCTSTSECSLIDPDTGKEVTFVPSTGAIVSSAEIDSPEQFLSNVSCPAGATFCSAVDSAGSAITFNPQTGAVMTSAGISDNPYDLGLWCSSSQCTTVSLYGTEVTYSPLNLAARSTGQLESVPQTPTLTGVSCLSNSECTAVDVRGNEITFNPSSPASASAVTIDPSEQLFGVSCGSTNWFHQCVALDGGGNEVRGTYLTILIGGL